MSNAALVREIYAAFGRGDVDAILARLAEDVVWEYGGTATDVPWFKPQRGREAVRRFFEALALLDIDRFEPLAILEDGDLVVTVLNFEARVKNNGRPIVEIDGVHIWRFRDGKVSSFRQREDTFQQHMAWHGI